MESSCIALDIILLQKNRGWIEYPKEFKIESDSFTPCYSTAYPIHMLSLFITPSLLYSRCKMKKRKIFMGILYLPIQADSPARGINNRIYELFLLSEFSKASSCHTLWASDIEFCSSLLVWLDMQTFILINREGNDLIQKI